MKLYAKKIDKIGWYLLLNLRIYVKLYAKKIDKIGWYLLLKVRIMILFSLVARYILRKKTKFSNLFIIIYIHKKKKVHRYSDIFKIKHAKK